jgi:hypothetical protein
MKKLLRFLTREVGTEVLEMGHEGFSAFILGSSLLFVCTLVFFIAALVEYTLPANVIIEYVALLAAILYFTARIAMYEE